VISNLADLEADFESNNWVQHSIVIGQISENITERTAGGKLCDEVALVNVRGQAEKTEEIRLRSNLRHDFRFARTIGCGQP
jgi:hypothetical protein